MINVLDHPLLTPREGHRPRRVFLGDNCTGIKPGLWLSFTRGGPDQIEVVTNPGADTVIEWDDGDMQVCRYEDEGFERPAVFGLATPPRAPNLWGRIKACFR